MHAFESRITAKLGRLRPSIIADYRMLVEKHLQDWKNRSLSDITKNMIMQRFNEIGKESGFITATYAMRVFSVTYKHLIHL